MLQPPEDYAALKAWALEQAAALAETRREFAQAQTGLLSASLMIEKLKIELARLRRETYGASSEKLVRRQLKRGQLLKFFGGLRPVLAGIEACGSAH